jgi:CubicO group peptidase (beta-lactamase class C family)
VKRHDEIHQVLAAHAPAKPAFAAAVIGADGVVTRVENEAARQNGAPALFEIGSVTKTFTATLLAELAVRGDARLDDSVAAYLPEGAVVPSFDGRTITLLDLATHTSGLPRLPHNLISPWHPVRTLTDPYRDYTPEQLLDFLRRHRLRRAPGTEYEYSNVGFGLLGFALSHRLGAPLGGLRVDRVAAPLGLGDTCSTETPGVDRRAARAVSRFGWRSGLWHNPTLGGAGSIVSTLDDMLAFVRANLAAASAGDGGLPAALRLTHEPRAATTIPNVRIGLAWHVRERPGEPALILHNGGTGGYRSFVGFRPDDGAAIVVLSASARLPIDALALELIA